jgi:hypothetical protein
MGVVLGSAPKVLALWLALPHIFHTSFNLHLTIHGKAAAILSTSCHAMAALMTNWMLNHPVHSNVSVTYKAKSIPKQLPKHCLPSHIAHPISLQATVSPPTLLTCVSVMDQPDTLDGPVLLKLMPQLALCDLIAQP